MKIIRLPALKVLIFTLAAMLLSACGASGESGPIKPKGNVIAGRVTMEDGSPLRGDIQDVVIGISGVSGAGQEVSYTPVVKPDGTYSQKVAHGMYSFSSNLFCYVVIMYGDIEFHLPLSLLLDGRAPPPPPGDRYLIVCAHGVRSLGLTEQLRSMGYRDVYSLRGGLAALSP